MDIYLNEAIYSLKKGIEEDERVKRLDELDKKLNTDEEAMILSYRKDEALRRYNDALKIYKEDSEEVSLRQKELYEAKLKLDSHPLVKEYNQAYKEVRLLYEEINDKLFNPFFNKGHLC